MRGHSFCPSQRSSSSSRAGISLLEVLISMGVLAVGLLGVGALIPAGRHEIATAIRLEDAAMVGRNAFRDLQVRGYLSPGTADGATTYWEDAGGTAIWDPDPAYSNEPFMQNGTRGGQLSVIFDPLGIYAPAGASSAYFPEGTTATDPHLTRIVPFHLTGTQQEKRAVFDTIFRGSSDLTIDDTAGANFPPVQKFFQGPTPPDPIRRASAGDYSWIATLVTDLHSYAATGEVVVSVAVFHKRDLSGAGAGEFSAEIDTGSRNIMSGASTLLKNFQSKATPAQTVKGLRPGQWVMVGAVLSGVNRCRWYRVLSASPYDKTNNEQVVTLSGSDWNLSSFTPEVWIMDNVVAVYEKTMPLDIR